MTPQYPAAPETEHTPVDVYEMPDESAESLHARIEAGTAVLAFRVCEKCAPAEVLDRIEDGDLDLSDGDALAAQWPCEFVTPAAPEAETKANGLTEAERETLAKVEFATWAGQGERYDIEWADHLLPAVERIVAERVRVVEDERDAALAEGEISGQMRHITAEMVRGDQPLEAKEEVIADLRARLSHAEAERDAAREKAEWWERTCTYWNEQATEAQRFRDMNAARAESAEAAHEAEKAAHERLRAAVKALDRGHSTPCTHPDDACVCVVSIPLFDLRALLAGGGAR